MTTTRTSTKISPLLIIINQSITEAFYGWVIHFAEAHGPVELWTGNPPENVPGAIKIRQLPQYKRQSALTRLITWLQFTLTSAWLLLFVSRRASVFSITNPPLMPLILPIYRVLLGRRYAILEYDLYPQVMTRMNIISEQHLVYKLWYRWHRWALKKASAVITISEVMASELKAMFRDTPIPICVIPTWTDTHYLKPLPKSENPFVIEHQLENKLVVLYSGNLGATHAIETILDVAEKLRDNLTVQFVVIGEGTKKKLVENYIVHSKNCNVLLLPLQPKEYLPYSLACADIACVTLAEGYERLSMPSKTYDMMATGNAILGISPNGSSLEFVIETYQCGVNFSPNQADKIAHWVEALAHNRDLLATMQHASRHAAEAHFNASTCQCMMTDLLYKSLIHSPAALPTMDSGS